MIPAGKQKIKKATNRCSDIPHWHAKSENPYMGTGSIVEQTEYWERLSTWMYVPKYELYTFEVRVLHKTANRANSRYVHYTQVRIIGVKKIYLQQYFEERTYTAPPTAVLLSKTGSRQRLYLCKSLRTAGQLYFRHLHLIFLERLLWHTGTWYFSKYFEGLRRECLCVWYSNTNTIWYQQRFTIRRAGVRSQTRQTAKSPNTGINCCERLWVLSAALLSAVGVRCVTLVTLTARKGQGKGCTSKVCGSSWNTNTYINYRSIFFVSMYGVYTHAPLSWLRITSNIPRAWYE